MKDVRYDFGPFRLEPLKRRLDGPEGPVSLGTREFDILAALVEKRGKTVTHAALIQRVWENRHVHEASLRIQISGLRKALNLASPGENYIVTVPGEGYRFDATIRRFENDGDLPGRTRPLSPRRSIPSPLTRIIGRANVIPELARQVEASRLVTVLGFAGVGKTTVCMAAAAELEPRFANGACWVDLAAISSEGLVATNIAVALDVGIGSGDALTKVIAHLRERETLLVLDNCEHLLDEVSHVVSKLLSATEKTRVLTTTRTLLDVRGQSVNLLEPLELPSEADDATPEAIGTSPAVELFAQRVRTSVTGFQLDPQNAAIVADICRRLEGIPLALEFAASRVQEFGLSGVAARVNESFSLLTSGRRTALPRHQALKVTIEWSASLMEPHERTILEALSIFSDSFTLSSAVRVACADGEDRGVVTRHIVGLASKSMLSTLYIGDEQHYRLLEMTREYARERLVASDLANDVARRHAMDCVAILQEAEGNWPYGAGPDWRGMYGHKIADVRSAIGWARSSDGDAHIAIHLIALGAILYLSIGLIAEYRGLLETAIELNLAVQDDVLGASLYCSLGLVRWHMRGNVPDSGARQALLQAADIAHRAGEWALEMRATSALGPAHFSEGEYDLSLLLADRFKSIPGGSGSFVEHRTMTHSCLFAGLLEESDSHFQAAMENYSALQDVRNAGSSYDQHQVVLRAANALCIWLMGKTDRAMQSIGECVADGRTMNNAVSYCQLLAAYACPLTFMTYGSEAAMPLVDELLELTERHSLSAWGSYAKCFKIKMQPSGGEIVDSIDMQADDQSLWVRGIQLDFMSVLGDGFTEEWMIRRPRRSKLSWTKAELLRATGEIEIRKGDIDGGLALFEQSRVLAVGQRAKAWELRTANSLANVYLNMGRRREARETIEGVLSTITEGFGSVDYRHAVSLLEICQGSAA